VSVTNDTQTAPATADSAPSAMLDVQAVADMLSCSTRHVYRLADAGRMPRPVKLGALVRWPRSTGNPHTGILDWIADGCPNCRKAVRP